MFRDIEKMKRRRAAMIKEARELINKAEQEERSLHGDEREKYDRIMEDVRGMDDDIQREEHLQKLEMSDPANQARDHDPERDRAEWRSLGEFAHAVVHNPGDQRLQNRAAGAQTMGEGTEGGFLVPEQFSEQLLTVQPDEAIIKPRATVFTGGEADFKIPALRYSGENMFAGAAVSWISEGGTKPQTDLTFKQITLQPYEIAAHIEVTDRLLRNSNIIEQVVRTQLRNALIAAEEEAFLTGDGDGKPTGIVNHASTITVSHSTAISYDELADMLAKFRGRRGVWICGRDVLPKLMVIKDENDNYVWQPNARDGNPGTLFGYPVVFSDHSPAEGTQGAIVLADLSYYLIKEGTGVSIAASSDFKFTNNVTVIKAFKTVDGTPWLSGELPTKGGNYTTSPFVELGAR